MRKHLQLLALGPLAAGLLALGEAFVELDFETWGRAMVRNLKDWLQMFSQLGLGAAAIQTLRN